MSAEDMADLRLVDYKPRSELVVDAHPIERAKFPVVDAHCHLGRIFKRDADSPARLVEIMDACNIRAIMSLDVGREASMDIAETVDLVALDGRCLRGKCDDDTALGYDLLKRFSSIVIARLSATRLQLMDMFGGKS